MHRFKSKVAIVTASTEGIGFAIAKRLAQEGAKVIISSRKKDNVINAVDKLRKDGLEVAGTICHVGKTIDRINLLKFAIETYGSINILVSNAGINPAVGPVIESDESVWDKIFDINVKSACLLAKEAVPYLKQTKNANIVFISSIAGYDSIPILGTYSVSKTALIGLTKTASKDLGRDGIRVNCVAPGIIRTKFSEALHADKNTLDAILSNVTLGRSGYPHEIAGVVAFLASEDASYITGETIVAAGGMTSRL